MSRSKILVVEDEQDVLELMLIQLNRQGFDVSTATTGTEALRMISENQYDLAILDWMLPEFSGIQICKSIHQNTPVLMVTARSSAEDIIEGLDAGADDYITKPFDLGIFNARLRSLLRRKRNLKTEQKVIEIGPLKLDSSKHEVSCNGEAFQLTPSEFKLLHALMLNSGKVLSRERLIELVQGTGVSVIDRSIDTHIFGLRKKMGACQSIIETIRGIGYRINTSIN